MTVTPNEALQNIIERNAALLGEAVTIGVHELRDGRVRVYDLGRGWRRRGAYWEYRSIGNALAAARIAHRRANRVHALMSTGVSRDDAIRRVVP